MEFRVDRMCFDTCMTVYDLAARIALTSDPAKKVKRANIVKGNYIGVVVEFEDVVHTYDLDQLAILIGCKRAVVCKRGNTEYICGL